jgi:hypothetical protein
MIIYWTHYSDSVQLIHTIWESMKMSFGKSRVEGMQRHTHINKSHILMEFSWAICLKVSYFWVGREPGARGQSIVLVTCGLEPSGSEGVILWNWSNIIASHLGNKVNLPDSVNSIRCIIAEKPRALTSLNPRRGRRSKLRDKPTPTHIETLSKVGILMFTSELFQCLSSCFLPPDRPQQCLI